MNIRFFSLSLLLFTATILLSSCRNGNDANVTNFTFCELKIDDFNDSELFTDFSLVQLETLDEALIGDNPDLKYVNNKFYIYEGQTGRVQVFSSEGRFLYGFSHRGKGPGEYLRGEDFLIDSLSNTVEILSLQNKGIFIYDEQGKFIEKIDTKGFAYSFTKDKNGRYWLFKGPYSFDENTLNNQVYQINKSSQILGCFLPDSSNLKMPITETTFTVYNGEILFRTYFDNNVYSISKDTIRAKYTFDFGEWQFPKESLQTDKRTVYSNLISRTNVFINKVIENDTYIYFYLRKEGIENSQYHFIYNKKTLDYKLLEAKMEDANFLGIGPARFITNNNELIFIVDPVSYNETLSRVHNSSSHSEKLNVDINYIIVKVDIDNFTLQSINT